MKKNQRNMALFVVYAMYLLTGASCVAVGSSISSLMQHYDKSLSSIAVLASAFAIGRVATVFPVGLIAERIGNKKTIMIGVILQTLFLIGIPFSNNYVVALFLAAMAGIGMSTEDACCASVLKEIYPKTYPSALSAGQAFFSAGCFMPPLLMGIVLANQLSFKLVYIGMALLGGIMLFVIPFLKLQNQRIKNQDVVTKKVAYESATPESTAPESATPEIKTKGKKELRWNYFILGIACFSYFGVTNTVRTYTAPFIESFGISESVAVTVLTIFSVGCMLGAFVFIPILRKIHETCVLWINMTCAFICLCIGIVIQTEIAFFISYLFAGFFCGVVFSLLISIAVSLNPLRAGIAASGIGFVGGGADILSPLLTGAIITITNIRASFYYCIVMCAICIITSLGYRRLHKRREKEVNFIQNMKLPRDSRAY